MWEQVVMWEVMPRSTSKEVEWDREEKGANTKGSFWQVSLRPRAQPQGRTQGQKWGTHLRVAHPSGKEARVPFTNSHLHLVGRHSGDVNFRSHPAWTMGKPSGRVSDVCRLLPMAHTGMLNAKSIWVGHLVSVQGRWLRTWVLFT